MTTATRDTAPAVQQAPRLRTHVSVRDDGGDWHSFGPDDELPRWARLAITNPAAWETA